MTGNDNVTDSGSNRTPATPPNRILYPADEVAVLLGVTTRFVHMLIARGDLQPTRIGRKVRVRRDRLDEFIERLDNETAAMREAART